MSHNSVERLRVLSGIQINEDEFDTAILKKLNEYKKALNDIADLKCKTEEDVAKCFEKAQAIAEKALK